MYCSRCGHANLDEARYCSRCGMELVVAPVPPESPPPPPAPVVQPAFAESLNVTPVEYAGFWLRFVAFVIDAAILAIINVSLVLAAVGGFFLSFGLPVIAAWLYFALMESSAKQATIGKLALGLAVTDTAHRRISFARATGRHFGKWISGVILFIGYMMAGFTEKKQALHDMLADTLVVKR